MNSEMYDAMYRNEKSHWYYHSKHDIVLSLIEKEWQSRNKSDLSLIDYGCGCGLMLKMISKYGVATGVDFSEKAVEYCKSNFSGDVFQADLVKLL